MGFKRAILFNICYGNIQPEYIGANFDNSSDVKGWFIGMDRKKPLIGLSVFVFSVLACNIGVLPPQENLDGEPILTIVVQTTPVNTLQVPSVSLVPSITPISNATDTSPPSVSSDAASATALSFSIPTKLNLPPIQSNEKPTNTPIPSPTNTPVMRPVQGEVMGTGFGVTSPVEDAKVLIQPGDYEATTDAGGMYHFDGIPVGEVIITVSKSKYSTEIRNETIKVGQLNNFDFELEEFNPHETTPTPCPFIICLPVSIPTAVPDNPFFEP